jgi:hypothetical protein
VRKLGLEGVVGKSIGSIYEPGERSGAASIVSVQNLELTLVFFRFVSGPLSQCRQNGEFFNSLLAHQAAHFAASFFSASSRRNVHCET